MARWTFSDGVLSESYTVPINPKEGGSPSFQKTMTYLPTPAGDPIVFEGRDTPRTFEVEGTILEQSHLDTFEAWFNKNYQVQVTDDLGRSYWIYITDFSPRRAPTRNYPWRHTFTMSYTEVDW